MAKKTRIFWLSYDLGLKGDYEGLYRWLDNMQAKECGDSLAVFQFECGDKYLDEIKQSLFDAVEFSKTDRVYLIWRDESHNGVMGRFIIGKRKPAPWKGYGDKYEETQEDY